LEFDAVTREEHAGEADLPEHVVESGASLNDHKRAKNRTIDITGIVSNTPLDFPPRSGFASQSISTSTVGGVITFSEDFNRVQDVAETIERLRVEPIDLTVETAIATYDNVQLAGYSIPRADPEDAAEFSLKFVQIRRAETQTVEAPLPREPRAAHRTTTTTETREETEADPATNNESWLHELMF